MGLLDTILDPETIAAVKQLNEPSEEQMRQARNNALMNAGFSMMINNGGMSKSQALFNALGNGGMAGMNSYAQSVGDAREQNNQQLQQALAVRKIMEEQKQKQAQQAAIGQLPQNEQQAILAGVPYAKIWERNNPEKKIETVYDTNGREIKAFVNPDGSYTPVGAAKSGVTAINLGGKTVFADPTSLNGKSLAHTMSPGESANLGIAQQRLALDRQQAFKPTFQDGQWVYPPMQGAPNGVAVTPNGMNPKAPTGEQAKALGFLNRMSSAEKIFSDPSSKDTPGYVEGIAGSLPVIGDFAANAARSPERQMAFQAKEDWVRAKLRKESGAVIGKDEMEQEIRTYFPMVGDSPEVIAQKAQARRVAMQSMALEGGPSAKTETIPPKSKQFKLDDGKAVIGQLGADGNYYVVRGGKKFKVEE